MVKDMTKGSPMKLILGFAIPMLMGMLFQQFYNLVDTMIVGKTLGVDALAERCTAHNVYDYISISDEYSIYEIPIVPSWIGKSLKEIDVRAVYNVNVIAIIQSDGNVMVMPKVDYALQEADHVKIIGSKEDVAKLLKEIPEKE